MPTTSRNPIENLSPQVEKRDSLGDNRVGDSNGEGPVAVVGLVVAALTLLVAIVSLRSSRFRRWVSRQLPSRFFKIAPGITPPNPPLITITTTEDLSTFPTSNIAIPGVVFIYNDYFNTRLAGAYPNTFPYGIAEDGRVPQPEEPLHPRMVEPAVSRQFP
ncbi:hypothetical protein HOY82DRAFT_536333 [Tuber indicum]|nr:hypothetical protein HOY82DRAFT_536333 [Tuber indicum]